MFLQDVNDNPPIIAPMTTNFTLLENVAVGQIITTIPATDADRSVRNSILNIYKSCVIF